LQQDPTIPLSALIRNKSRSLGVKLIVVSGLALLMTIPSFFVDSVVEDRAKLKQSVITEISNHVGGEQTFLGPTLTIPYTIPPLSTKVYTTSGVYVVFPAKGDAAATIHTEERRRSLFRVPVYQAELKFEATFDLTGIPSAAPIGAELD
jgi:inner membrane protein